jgi:hypothetical protein
MSVTTIAQIAQIVAPTVLAAGVVIGIIQLREFQRQRREVAAVELVHSFRNAEFNRALRLMWGLPEPMDAAALRARGPEYEDAAVLVGTTFEAVGVLVYRRVVPIEILDDLMGDAIVMLWSKLSPWVAGLRREQGRESVYEWFQWVADRMQERDRRTHAGAHTRFRSWKE